MTGPLEPAPISAGEARELINALDPLTEEVRRQGRFGKWNRRFIVTLALIVAALLVLALFAWRSAAYAICTTQRSQALAGPGAERVSYMLDAFRSSALGVDAHLTDRQRAADVVELRKDRGRYPVIPADAKLGKLPDSRLLVYVDVIRAITADDQYTAALAAHPVCSLWGF